MKQASERFFSLGDRVLTQFDRVLRTLSQNAQISTRPSPSDTVTESELSAEEKKHSAGLMRVNHSGEVCAQALYQGQALTAKLPHVREDMEQAASEEADHLAWCEGRLKQLGSHTSILNPIWYGMSFGIGAGAGLIGDKVSLGFVAATEAQVCKHLEGHLKQLPEQDHKSRSIVEVMLEDEYRHGQSALDAGGFTFPRPVTTAMSIVSKLMTVNSYKV